MPCGQEIFSSSASAPLSAIIRANFCQSADLVEAMMLAMIILSGAACLICFIHLTHWLALSEEISSILTRLRVLLMTARRGLGFLVGESEMVLLTAPAQP